MNTTPVTPKGIQTRENVLSAARVVFGVSGYVNMRMGDVAIEAGLSMGTLYRYFRNKEDLFASLIANIHEQLYAASTTKSHHFDSSPYEALLEANYGYLECYYENRDMMRALFEAVTVDPRDRAIWWRMRQRHIQRFCLVFERIYGGKDINGVDILTLVDAMVSMVEQSAYCWYAQEHLNRKPISIKDAAKTVTHIWYQAFFNIGAGK